MALRALGRAVGEWTGRAQIQYTHAPAPLALEDTSGAQTDLLEICRESTPPCHLNPLLFNGHLQTAWSQRALHGPAVHYRRRIFQAEHQVYAGTFTVDFVVPPPPEKAGSLGKGIEGKEDVEGLPPRTSWFADGEFAQAASDDSRPQLVVLHGLSGGSHEVYLRHTIEPLIRSGKWEVCVVNSRGCAMSTLTSGVLYNARATWDVRQVVRWLGRTHPNRPLFGLGFSLGANIMTNYVAEEGAGCLFKGAVVCSNPWNLEVSCKVLQSSFVGREIYLRALAAAMCDLLGRHKKEILEYTTVDWSVLESVKYLYEFDREVQHKIWGYPTEGSYYRDASSADSVLSVRIPFFAINATDDPLSVDAAIPYEEFKRNPCAVLCTTSLGGHLGWFESNGERWYTKPVCNFLDRMAFGLNLDGIVPSENPEVPGAKHGHRWLATRRRMETGEE